jgi:hypothetical protein
LLWAISGSGEVYQPRPFRSPVAQRS